MIKAGSIGEVSVMKFFILRGFEIYSPISDNSKYDLLVMKDSSVYRVEVKSTSRKRSNGRYEVQLKSVRSNKKQNKIHLFDCTSIDILAVYIEPEDRVVVYDASAITQKVSMIID